jgi:hypothetical protein
MATDSIPLKLCGRKEKCVHPDGPLLYVQEFHRDKRSTDGLQWQCKRCLNKTSAEWRKKDKLIRPEKYKLLQARKRINRQKKGLCEHCGKPSRPGRTNCARCAEKSSIRRNPHRKYATDCVICGFPYSDVHHIDKDHNNNRPDNLISLCPNHHRMVHRNLLCILPPNRTRNSH